MNNPTLPSLKDLMLPVRLELVFLVLLAMAPPLVRELLLSTVGLIGHK